MNQQQRYTTRSEEVTGKVIDGEAIIMNLADGSYYSLDGPGALIWERLQTGHALGQVATAMVERYAVDPGQAEADLHRLVTELVDEGLLVASAADSVPNAAPEPSSGEVYQVPELRKFTDMADLLALDPPMPGFDETPWAKPDATGRRPSLG